MQANNFMNKGEGNNYFRRNLEAMDKLHEKSMADFRTDPILKKLDELRPKKIIEVGASNGWRLDVANKLFGIEGIALEPSLDAIEDGKKRFPNVSFSHGVATNITSLNAYHVDAVVFAWCLYLVDRSDLFSIAHQAHMAINPGGHIIIYDFCTQNRYANPYHHRNGLFSYKMNYADLWSWHPNYVVWSHEVLPFHDEDPRNEDNRLALTVLKHVI